MASRCSPSCFRTKTSAVRCIIAGGRDVADLRILEAALAACPFAAEITTVVSGCARGVDRLGEAWATAHGLPIVRFPWASAGKAGGPIRNERMARAADALVAIPGAGPGTRDMIRRANAHQLRVFIFEVSHG